MTRLTPWQAALLAALALAACDGEVGPPRQPEVVDRSVAPDAEPADAEPTDAEPTDAGTLDTGSPDADPTDATMADPDLGEPDATVPPPLAGWRLTWHDEFDAPAGSPVDPTRWVHDVGGDGWGNAQLEHNTDRVENAAHDGQGHLVITARAEAYRGNAYTSARLKTQGLFAQRHGRFEARIKLPVGQGMWPAFWLLGDDITEVGWPRCGEIDVMEFRGQRPRESTGALHGPGYSAGQSIHGAYPAPTALPDDFHVFAAEWDAAGIRWLVDEVEFLRVDPGDQPPGAPWVYDHPFFILLNLAVGGTFVGAPDASTVFPQAMWVDYVRVYEAAP